MQFLLDPSKYWNLWDARYVSTSDRTRLGWLPHHLAGPGCELALRKWTWASRRTPVGRRRRRCSSAGSCGTQCCSPSSTRRRSPAPETRTEGLFCMRSNQINIDNKNHRSCSSCKEDKDALMEQLLTQYITWIEYVNIIAINIEYKLTSITIAIRITSLWEKQTFHRLQLHCLLKHVSHISHSTLASSMAKPLHDTKVAEKNPHLYLICVKVPPTINGQAVRAAFLPHHALIGAQGHALLRLARHVEAAQHGDAGAAEAHDAGGQRGGPCLASHPWGAKQCDDEDSGEQDLEVSFDPVPAASVRWEVINRLHRRLQFHLHSWLVFLSVKLHHTGMTTPDWPCTRARNQATSTSLTPITARLGLMVKLDLFKGRNHQKKNDHIKTQN